MGVKSLRNTVVGGLAGGMTGAIGGTLLSLANGNRGGSAPQIDARGQELLKQVQAAADKGEVSKKTLLQIQQGLQSTAGAPTVMSGLLNGSQATLNAAFANNNNIDAWTKVFNDERSGTSASGKSRLATQKLFEISVDRPGRKQTLLTPRSNASKAIVGV